MTLKRSSTLLDSPQLIAATLLSLACVCGTLAFIALTDNSAARSAKLGQMLADNLASMSLDAFVTQDKIQLGLLSNHTAELDTVAAVTIFGANNALVAQAGAADASRHNPHRFLSAVRLDNADVGYVQVTLEPGAIPPALNWQHWAVGLGLALLAPLLCLTGFGFIRRWQQQPMASRVASVELNDNAGAATDDNDGLNYLLMANLQHQHNPFGNANGALLQTQQRAAAWGTQIAHLYGAQMTTHLDGTDANVVLTFADQPGQDHTFSVIYAALLWIRCLESDAEVQGFRLGLHLCAQAANSIATDTSFEDVHLLSAAAANGQLVLTEPVRQQLSRAERIALKTFVHPLHDELNTAQGDLFLVQGLVEPYDELLNEQHQQLTDQAPSIDNLSTF